MPPKRKVFHEVIKSPEHFKEVIDSTGPLVVIDAHLEWCGPCEPMI